MGGGGGVIGVEDCDGPRPTKNVAHSQGGTNSTHTQRIFSVSMGPLPGAGAAKLFHTLLVVGKWEKVLKLHPDADGHP